jgi:hypothetical protein
MTTSIALLQRDHLARGRKEEQWTRSPARAR